MSVSANGRLLRLRPTDHGISRSSYYCARSTCKHGRSEVFVSVVASSDPARYRQSHGLGTCQQDNPDRILRRMDKKRRLRRRH